MRYRPYFAIFTHIKPAHTMMRHSSHRKANAVKENLSTNEAAKFLGVAVVTLETWRSTQKGPPYVRAEGRVIYRMADLRAWMDANVVTAKG